jgi:hypothetical protein
MQITWLTIRMRKRPVHRDGDFRFPPICANCGDPRPSSSAPLTGVTGQEENHFKVCEACHTFARRRERVDRLVLVGGILLIIAVLVLSSRAGLTVDGPLRIMLGLAVLGSLWTRRERTAHARAASATLGLVLVSHRKRLRDLFRKDSGRTLKVRVCHPAYARELIRMNAEICDVEYDGRTLQAMENEQLHP